MKGTAKWPRHNHQPALGIPERCERECGIVHQTEVMQDARWAALLSCGCSCACVATSEVSLLSMRRLTFAVAFLAVLVLAAKPSSAQTWPQRTVKFIVTLGPGSGVDIGTRLIADRLIRRWRQPVGVENRPGGDGPVPLTAFLAPNHDHLPLAPPTRSFPPHPLH